MRLLDRLYNWGAMRSFGRPRGLAGRYADWVMRRKGRASSEWVVSLLDIQPDDQVLEVGFGPGRGIQYAAEAITDGTVKGIDHSSLMVQRATNRNREAIEAGRVELQKASAMSLPYDDESFEKAFSINSIQFWPSAEAGMQELYRVLKSDGRIGLAFNPHAGESSSQLTGHLEQASFQNVRMEKSEVAHCALGEK